MSASRRAPLLLLIAALLIAGPAASAGARGRVRHDHRRHARVHAVRHRRHRRARSAAAGRSCAGASTPAASGNPGAMRAAVMCLVNAERISRGLPRLSEDSRLDRSAQRWSAAMVKSGQFTHGADFAARIAAAGFDWSAAGENIATGYPTPVAVVAAWMASPGHCRNILSTSYSALGIGVVAAAVRGAASGPATWTQDFALPMGRSAPSGNQSPADGCPY